jgi:hypothetical protein
MLYTNRARGAVSSMLYFGLWTPQGPLSQEIVLAFD